MKKDAVQLTKEMVKIKSYSFMENQEEEISKYILDFFTENGITSYRTEIVPGRYNTFAILKGEDSENNPSLLLTGHMDTVPAYDFKEAFTAREDADYLYGRGSCDMKGALAAMMCAMVNIKESGTKLKGDLIFCGVADEEEAGIGTESLIKTGPEATYAVIGEPTKLEIALGHKGLEWIEISFKGKKVHGGAQKDGVNAIMMAGRFLHKLETEYLPKLEKRTHPVLGTATLNIGTITGGDQPSTVADKCSIRLDRRCLTDETMPHIPFCTDGNSPLVKAAENALGREGMTPVLTCFPAWSDAGFMNALTKSECIVLGPGDLAVAHSIHEKISKRQLLSAVSVYEEMAREICKTVWT